MTDQTPTEGVHRFPHDVTLTREQLGMSPRMAAATRHGRHVGPLLSDTSLELLEVLDRLEAEYGVLGVALTMHKRHPDLVPLPGPAREDDYAPIDLSSADDLAAAIYQTVGAGSMAWADVTAAGVFDDRKARAAGEGLLKWLRERGVTTEGMSPGDPAEYGTDRDARHHANRADRLMRHRDELKDENAKLAAIAHHRLEHVHTLEAERDEHAERAGQLYDERQELMRQRDQLAVRAGDADELERKLDAALTECQELRRQRDTAEATAERRGTALDTREAELRAAERSPNVGCATTAHLIAELHARAEIAAIAGEAWPLYSTVGDEPHTTDDTDDTGEVVYTPEKAEPISVSEFLEGAGLGVVADEDTGGLPGCGHHWTGGECDPSCTEAKQAEAHPDDEPEPAEVDAPADFHDNPCGQQVGPIPGLRGAVFTCAKVDQHKGDHVARCGTWWV